MIFQTICLWDWGNQRLPRSFDISVLMNAGIGLGGGVILDQYNPDSFTPAVVSRIRDELGIPPGNLVIGTVGRLVREKGYLELFEAVRMLKQDSPNVTLLVVGREDPEKDDTVTREMVDQLGLGETVIFAGPIATPALYAAMDIFVLASHREGLPRTPMEAAAMAKPLVVTDIRGCRQIVDNGLNGFLVPVKDAPSLAQALTQLLENETLRRQLGQAARQKAVVQFDYRSTVRTMLKVYQEALQ